MDFLIIIIWVNPLLFLGASGVILDYILFFGEIPFYENLLHHMYTGWEIEYFYDSSIYLKSLQFSLIT